MKHTILLAAAITALATAASAFACTAFYDRERVSGMNKICYYDHLGSEHAITVDSYEICPTTVEVRH